MLPIETLEIWSSACEKAGVKWSLYKETLLCAEGYGEFPENLTVANVAVFAKDLRKVVNEVLTAFPQEYCFLKKFFITGKKLLCLTAVGTEVPLLTVDVLYPVSSQEHMELAANEAKTIKRSTAKSLRNTYIISKFFGDKAAGIFAASNGKKVDKAMGGLANMAAAAKDELPYYCEIFTEKEPILFDAELFAEFTEINCGGRTYPVFAGYKTYLSDTYCDYKIGLSDDIGVGLTEEEKLELKEHQKHCFEALKFLQEISEEFGLRYYLLAGSVLGAVRHKGFIPWDDDIDVGLRLEDLKRFEDVVKAEIHKRLPAGYTLMENAPKHPYPRMFSKICYEGRCCIDLWPLVPTQVEGIRAKFKWYFGKIITKVHYRKIGHPNTRFVKLVNLMAAFMSDRFVMWTARLNEKLLAGKNPPAYINLYSIYPRRKEVILTKWLDTPATEEFEGIRVPVVGCTHDYLTHLYRDYMSFPPPWKRASRHVARFDMPELF